MASKDSQEATQNQNDKSHGIDINERSLKSEQTQSMALQNSKEAIPNQDNKSGLFSYFIFSMIISLRDHSFKTSANFYDF